jgi:hypothetical protein
MVKLRGASDDHRCSVSYTTGGPCCEGEVFRPSGMWESGGVSPKLGRLERRATDQVGALLQLP